MTAYSQDITAALADWRPAPAEFPAVRPTLVLQRARSLDERFEGWRLSVSEKLQRLDVAPDLAQNIGSRRWFRGFGTMVALAAAAIALWPDFSPLETAPPMHADQRVQDEFRSRTISPLAFGADTGLRVAATSRVVPLRTAPERPQIQLFATLSHGDGFARMLQQAGVASEDAARVEELVAKAIPLSELEPGTAVDITLGRRPAPGAARPLDELVFRARFDLELSVARTGSNLALERKVIRVDDTPLRIRGTVGQGLYRSARAAGAPASAVQQYLKALSNQLDLERDVAATDTFDLIVAHRRAATGERQAGQLLYAGLERDGAPKAQLMRWGEDGKFYEASGVGEERSGMVAPVPGRMTSRYGMRRHPILGYRRMHSGLDFRAAYGTPIVAVTDGTVSGAGRMGGCGSAVRLNHGDGLQTRYCHMSRMAVRSGQSVRRGQVIGYAGSTGLSTGPHLHYEMYRNGRAIDPSSVRFVTRAQLSGEELRRFRETLRKLKTVEPGAALAELELRPSERDSTPTREIEKLENPQPVG